MAHASTVYLKDYQPPAFWVESVQLTFQLQPTGTEVISLVHYKHNPNSTNQVLELDGFELELLDIQLNGHTLPTTAYRQHELGISIDKLPKSFTLQITTRINPEANTALEGLYRSSGNYCTQCEAQGFRRITYYQDRPDVMAPFTVKIIADKATNPVLLSNGNPINSGDLDDDKHFVEWHDPFPKPCYLFALVAGDLAKVEDSFTTQSGRDITLQIYTEPHHIHQCDFAMASLKRAMAWDEQRFALEYDLDLFMIVAVDDFNMGAMENKGLNIFNSRLVFASPETATDDDYIAIEAVIGHEYFHNWTGNRVTCRDWFQLSLKEGLTVFRDQEFTADLHDRAVKRIEDVRLLRTHQFAEDTSPMAHPIRPASFVEINNFYTVTVYEKGAEVVRLYHSLLGEQGFRKGMDLYFERHDGQAVTTEDFLSAMADANNRDLSQMQTWYNQAGTPHLKVSLDYDADTQTCTLTCEQSCPATAESQNKKPYLIPLKMVLLDKNGNMLMDEQTLLVTQEKQVFTFASIRSQPIPSLLRDFSAPVILEYDYSDSDYAFLMQHDNNPFNQWSAAQALASHSIMKLMQDKDNNLDILINAMKSVLENNSLPPALKAEALSLPSISDMQEAWLMQHDAVNPSHVFSAREQLKSSISQALRDELLTTYQTMQDTADLSDGAMQQRKLKHVCLAYLTALGEPEMLELAMQQFNSAQNMTSQYAALHCLVQHDNTHAKEALQSFEQQWKDETNVMDKWFAVQASSPTLGSLAHIQTLMQHPQFSIKNPNKVRAVLGGFAMRNPSQFHAENGSGYQFMAEKIIALDKLNPQIAARMVRTLMNWKRLDPVRQNLMKAELQRITDTQGLSSDVLEVVNKSLT
ncbi:MAG: aminopeptidase N [Mariprofundaceae bacterium]|nr:aminopeptidase N [Mariprofundaceae bacterium]